MVGADKLYLAAGLFSGGEFMARRRETTLIVLLFTTVYIWVSLLLCMWFCAFFVPFWSQTSHSIITVRV